jgi:hypothetical protein
MRIERIPQGPGSERLQGFQVSSLIIAISEELFGEVACH